MRLLRVLFVIGGVCLVSTPAYAADPPAALAKRAQAIHNAHCYECHGEAGGG